MINDSNRLYFLIITKTTFGITQHFILVPKGYTKKSEGTVFPIKQKDSTDFEVTYNCSQSL